MCTTHHILWWIMAHILLHLQSIQEGRSKSAIAKGKVLRLQYIVRLRPTRNQHLRTWEIGINFGMTTSLYQIKALIKLHYVVMFVCIH
jgi:hypothetical protein